MLKTYEYRLYPTPKQEELLAKHFGCARLVYNKALALKTEMYKKEGKNLSFFDLVKELTKWKQTEEFSFLYEVSNVALKYSLRHLDIAYKNFFRNSKFFCFPKFKNKHSKQSYEVIEHCSVDAEKGIVKIPKFQEGIKARIHRVPKGLVKNCIIKKTTTGKYFISVLVEDGIELPLKKEVKPETAVGVDLGVKTLATISNGEVIENMHFLRNSEERLKVLQRRASKKAKGSSRQKKAYKLVALFYEKINDRRKDYINKFTSKLVHDNQVDTICLEDLNVSGMVKNRKLAKSINDSAFREIRRQLEYKCEWNGKNLLFVSRFYPSSKTCSNCGYIKEDLTLKDREWSCPICGAKHDRDFNASVNIRDEALRNYFSGRGSPVGLVELPSIEGAEKREQLILKSLSTLEQNRI